MVVTPEMAAAIAARLGVASGGVVPGEFRVGMFMGWVAFHVALALAMRKLALLGVPHAVIATGAGLFLAARGRLAAATAVCAYIAGSDVLWRMNNVPIFWETGKYAITLIMVAAAIRTRRGRPPLGPAVYLLALLPSALLTASESTTARQLLDRFSFNLSGPLALGASAFALWDRTLTRTDLLRILGTALGPICGIGSVCVFGIATTEVDFSSTESNFGTSGGFGPNQVSSVLGLGVTMGFAVWLNARSDVRLRATLMAMALALSGLSALTMSRSGLYQAGIAICLGLPFLMRDGRAAARAFAGILAALAIGMFGVLPALDSFSGGKLSERFREKGYSHRDRLIMGDLKIFLEHPLMGVGPGLSRYNRKDKYPTHSEATRMLAEHGLFGLISLTTLGVMLLRRIGRAGTLIDRTTSATLIAWSLLMLSANAFRIAAPALLCGLAMMTVVNGPGTFGEGLAGLGRARR